MIVTHNYDDIISLPHHVSKNHPQMSMESRAAQFSPFAALTGFGAAIEETARLTDAKLELSDDQKAEIDGQLNLLAELLAAARGDDAPALKIVYFRPDSKKAGGAYVTVVGAVKKVDAPESALFLMDGTRIPFEDIFSIEIDYS